MNREQVAVNSVNTVNSEQVTVSSVMVRKQSVVPSRGEWVAVSREQLAVNSVMVRKQSVVTMSNVNNLNVQRHAQPANKKHCSLLPAHCSFELGGQ
jgi:hypothetical protein